MAVAYGAKADAAEGVCLGTMGPRPGDLDHRLRPRPSTATPLLFVSDAGPWGSWLSRALTTNGADCWVGAPSLSPRPPGARVNTDRRDAAPWARLARSGALTGGDVPPVADDVRRELARARSHPTAKRAPNATTNAVGLDLLQEGPG